MKRIYFLPAVFIITVLLSLNPQRVMAQSEEQKKDSAKDCLEEKKNEPTEEEKLVEVLKKRALRNVKDKQDKESQPTKGGGR